MDQQTDMTAAELDDLRERITESLARNAGRIHPPMLGYEMRDAIASLRRQLDEAREETTGWTNTARVLFDECVSLHASNAQIATALRRTGEAWENLSKLESAPSNIQGSAHLFANEIKAVLAALSQEPSASHAPVLTEDECPACRELPGMGSSCPACASPSPGLRDAVIEHGDRAGESDELTAAWVEIDRMKQAIDTWVGENARLRSDLAQARVTAIKDAVKVMSDLYDDTPSGSYDNGGVPFGWRMACKKGADGILALASRPVSEREGENA